MMVSWDAMIIAGSILILSWVIFYTWRTKEKEEEIING